MSKKRPARPKTTDDFAALLADVKGRIQSAQTRAVLAVNTELVRLYWDIGRIIDGRQEREGWGGGGDSPTGEGAEERIAGVKGVFRAEHRTDDPVLP